MDRDDTQRCAMMLRFGADGRVMVQSAGQRMEQIRLCAPGRQRQAECFAIELESAATVDDEDG